MALKLKDIKGKKLEGYDNISIFEGFPYPFYEVEEISLDEKEKELAKLFIGIISRKIPLTDLRKRLGIPQTREFSQLFIAKIVSIVEEEQLVEKLPSTKTYAELKQTLQSFLEKYCPIENKNFLDYVLDNSVGYGMLGALVHDTSLEEIMVNGYDKNIFVFHKRHGTCKTNLVVEPNAIRIQALIRKIAQTVERRFSITHPLLDARLPDGSRANATFPYITPFGPSLTIRKFTPLPLSVVDLIEKGTFSAELAAFLWIMVDGVNVEPMNMIISGGAGTGKTTTLNCLSTLIRYRERIISIEDTLELNLGARENWIQMEAKPRMRDIDEITMDDLLKNSLRMRPDRLLVGEVRGSEAHTMFVAMDTGHRGLMGTLHANTARETLIRLKSEPMSVPESILPLLDLILVQCKVYTSDRGLIRRAMHLAEVARMNEKVLLSNIFEWNPKTDAIARTDVPTRVMETLAERAGMTKRELSREMLVRQRILEWMLENNVRDPTEVEKVIQGYYFNPEAILENVSKKEPLP